MRRSDVKQLRRRLTLAALRVWQEYTAIEKRLNVTFVAAQKFEAVLGRLHSAEGPDESDAVERQAVAVKLDDLRADARELTDLVAWYKAGHEQLNDMIRFADQRILALLPRQQTPAS